jgi:hypothetical protein
MTNNQLENIKITEIIDKKIDKAIDNGIEKAYIEIKCKKRKIGIGITAASIGILLTFSVANPALAAKLPIVGSVFKFIEKNLEAPGSYSKYATAVNETVSDNGINITMSDILCDGEGLYVTYIVKSKEPFKYISYDGKGLNIGQLLTSEAYNKVSFSNKELDNTGVAGLEGKFIDENTFVGMERYYLKSLGTEIPDNFNFEVKLTSVGTGGLNPKDKDQKIDGTWAFKVPVKVDKSISKSINVNYKAGNGFCLNSVLITPFNIVVNSTNPDHIGYGIKVFDDKNKKYEPDKRIIFDNNKQISYLNGELKECKHLRVIIYKNKMEKGETTRKADGSTDTNYKNLGEEILVDKTISIE